MFIANANTTFINKMFTRATISPMHETMTRLYEAARKMRGLRTPTEVAKLLNQFPQTLKNWEKRGISQPGMVLAEELIGCSTTWLRTGKEPSASTGQNVRPADEGAPTHASKMAWPFQRVEWIRVAALPPDELAFIEAKLETELIRAEERLGEKPGKSASKKPFLDPSLTKDEDYLLSGSPAKPRPAKHKRAS